MHDGQKVAWLIIFGAFIFIGCCAVYVPLGLQLTLDDDEFNKWRSEVVKNQTDFCSFTEINGTRPCSQKCNHGTETCTGTQYYHIGYAFEQCGADTPLGWWNDGCTSSTSQKELGVTFKCFIKDCEDGEISLKPVVGPHRTNGGETIMFGIIMGAVGGGMLMFGIISICIIRWEQRAKERANVSQLIEHV